MYFFVPNIAILSDKLLFSLSKLETEHFWSCRVETGQACELTDLCGFYCQVKILKTDRKNRQIDFEILKKNWISEQDFWQNKNQKQNKKLENGNSETLTITQIFGYENSRNKSDKVETEAGIDQKTLGKYGNLDLKNENQKNKFQNSQKFSKQTLFQAQTDKIYLEKWAEILPFTFFNQVFVFHSDFGTPQKFNFERLEKILIRSCCQAQMLYKITIKFVEKREMEKLLIEFKPIVLDCEINNLDNSEKIEAKLKTKNLTKKLKNSEIQKETQNKAEEIISKNYLVGAEGGFSESEKKYFAKIDLEFQNLGQIIYPSWLVCLMI